MTEERKHISKETQAIVVFAKEAATDLKVNLRKGFDEAFAEVQRLRNQTLELGKELGHFQAVVESNQWLSVGVKNIGYIWGSSVRSDYLDCTFRPIVQLTNSEGNLIIFRLVYSRTGYG